MMKPPVVLAILLTTATAPHAEPSLPDEDAVIAPLRAEQLYHGVDRPLMITIEPPASGVFVSLTLLDAEGRSLAPEQSVRPGRRDLLEFFPQLRELERAAWLQTLHNGEAAGPALVIQPMLSRLVPVTEPALRPDGTPYTRIVDWQHELDVPPPRPPERTAGGEATDETDEIAEDRAETPHQGDAVLESTERVLSGWRVYPDQDVMLVTTEGTMRLAMRPDEAPNTVWNFLELCRGGFYRDVIFHRVVPLTAGGDPFVIQAGDPSGTGRGGPGWWLPLEPSRLPHDFGVISMARADDPDSAGSQFFIGLSRVGTARLDGQYCAFGYAVEGAETILRIADSELVDPARGRAKAPPVIVRTALVAAPPREPGIGRPDARVRREADPDAEEDAATEPRPGRVPR